MNSAREYAATYEGGYRTFGACLCVLPDSTTADREAVKGKAERAWILIYGTLFWTARSDCLLSHKTKEEKKKNNTQPEISGEEFILSDLQKQIL